MCAEVGLVFRARRSSSRDDACNSVTSAQPARLVTETIAGGPASNAGMRAGDIIIGLDGSAVAGVDDLQRMLTAESIGRATEFALLREGQRVQVTVTPSEAPLG